MIRKAFFYFPAARGGKAGKLELWKIRAKNKKTLNKGIVRVRGRAACASGGRRWVSLFHASSLGFCLPEAHLKDCGWFNGSTHATDYDLLL